MAYVRQDGSPKNWRKYLSLASTTFAVGDTVQFDASTGVVKPAGTAEKTLGIVVTAKASTDATTGAIMVDLVRPTDEFVVAVGTGTMDATYIGKQADFKNSAGSATSNGSITLTASNNDVTIMGWDGYTTTKAIVKINATVAQR